MISLRLRIEMLCRSTRQLQFLGFDGQPVYIDRFKELNLEVYLRSESLISERGATVDEEAALCAALLDGYRSTFCDYGKKDAKIQSILERSTQALGRLTDPLLKCRLLVSCYGELLEPDLAAGAHAIISSWSGRKLSTEEQKVADELRSFEEYSRLLSAANGE